MMTWGNKKKEQLPDGRWQHFCPRCDVALTIERLYESDFDFKVPCDDCTPKDPGFGTLKKSMWD